MSDDRTAWTGAPVNQPAYPPRPPYAPPQYGPPQFGPPQYGPPPQPPKRRRSPWLWVGLAVAVAIVLGGGGVVAYAALGGDLTHPQNVLKDSGVTACEQLTAVAHHSAVPRPVGAAAGDDGLAILRKEFAGSRYDDLRTAGTEAIDLLKQFTGKNSEGMTLLAGGQFVQKWASLSGACSNHGVEIPSLSDMGGS